MNAYPLILVGLLGLLDVVDGSVVSVSADVSVLVAVLSPDRVST